MCIIPKRHTGIRFPWSKGSPRHIGGKYCPTTRSPYEKPQQGRNAFGNCLFRVQSQIESAQDLERRHIRRQKAWDVLTAERLSFRIKVMQLITRLLQFLHFESQNRCITRCEHNPVITVCMYRLGRCGILVLCSCCFRRAYSFPTLHLRERNQEEISGHCRNHTLE
jgi:hypothetical protein